MKIAVIGAGAMGGSLAKGLIQIPSVPNSDITVADPSEEKLKTFAAQGVRTTTDNTVAANAADLVCIVVKPWIVRQVIEQIKDSLDYDRQQLIIVAAGVKSADLNEWLKRGESIIPYYLVIPNIAIAVLSSMTFIVPCGASAAQTAEVKALFEQMGGALVTEERLLAAGTTLASCGIAYAMRYIRASVEGGVELGFRAADAEHIVEQTVKGAVLLLQATGDHPEAKIDEVTTPGGVTIRGLNEMEHAGFTSAVIRGLKAGL